MRPTRILVPVDGSDHSRKAADYAADLAASAGASLILLHCYRPVPLTLGQPNFQRVLDQTTAESASLLSFFEASFRGAGVPFESRSVGGPAAEVIQDVAAAEHCDLIVMGSRGKSDLEGLILGSVTHKVLHIAPCPVLVVR